MTCKYCFFVCSSPTLKVFISEPMIYFVAEVEKATFYDTMLGIKKSTKDEKPEAALDTCRDLERNKAQKPTTFPSYQSQSLKNNFVTVKSLHFNTFFFLQVRFFNITSYSQRVVTIGGETYLSRILVFFALFSIKSSNCR